MKNTSYLNEENLTKIRIDFTCSKNVNEFQSSHIGISYINKSLTECPQIKFILYFIIFENNILKEWIWIKKIPGVLSPIPSF